MRWVAVGSSAIVALIASSDLSIGAGLEGAYYCVTEVAGGISYDSSQKVWHGTPFKMDEKFVLRMTFIDTKRYPVPVRDTDGKWCDGKRCPTHIDLDFDRYQAKITPTGTDKSAYCDDDQSIGADLPELEHKVTVSAGGVVFRCGAGDRELAFNLSIKRFLMANMVGYIFDLPPGFETPGYTRHPAYLAGGTCTKIE